jgi:hypothetical protein
LESGFRQVLYGYTLFNVTYPHFHSPFLSC